MEETKKVAASAEFIKRGKVPALAAEALAESCDRFIHKVAHESLPKAVRLAERFVQRADGQAKIIRLTAFKALARVNHMSGKHRQARHYYLRARKLCREYPLIRARIDRVLIDVYMYLGDFEKAEQHARLALRTFRQLKAASDAALTQINIANLWHRRDRHRAAERLYYRAALFFDKSGNRIAAARCYYNRANTLVQLFDLPAAEELYEKAFGIYESEGYKLEATDARYGLAWLKMLRGEFHVAMTWLSDCESAYRLGGDPRGESLCILDRAEVFLGLGLYDDAFRAARVAEGRFLKMGLRYETAKAALFRGQAAQVLGIRNEASRSMRRAKRGFAAEGNRPFLGVAHLLAADLSAGEIKTRDNEIETARSLFTRSQLPLWQAVCDLKTAEYRGLAPGIINRLAGNRAVQHVPHLYTAWQTAAGDFHMRRGNAKVAAGCWGRAADRLDTVRAQLPPLELRSAYTRKSPLPHHRLIAHYSARDPLLASTWSEKAKTAGLWSPLGTGTIPEARQRVEGSLTNLAQEFAAMARQIGGAGGARGFDAGVRERMLTGLHKKLRNEMARVDAEKSQIMAADSRLPEAFTDISRRLPILHFHLQGDDISVFVHRDRNTVLRRFPGGRLRLAQTLQRWQFILESEILARYLTGKTQTGAEKHIWEELGSWLWAPLEISEEVPQILIIPDGELANLPWEAIIIHGRPLQEKHAFIISPSLRHFMAAEKADSGSLAVELFRGRGDDLHYVDREMAAIAAGAGAAAKIHAPSRRDDFLGSGDARIWHFAGHAVLRSDNPFYSYLDLDDGPVFAADLRLKQCRVNLVTLAACRTGEQVNLPGEESTGLVRSLLEMGARNVLAARWPVSDRSASLWMTTFYNNYFGGDNIYDAARQASRLVRGEFSSSYHWAAFSIFGAGRKGA